MHNKILKSYTIIPQEFYVYRNADNILREIINNMGRPGYVLVARQMGKTNLLLNAKRELQNSSNIFVYIDLSTLNGTSRDYFRNIVDITIDTHESIFSEAKVLVDRIRKEKELPEQKEHELELKTLLKYVKDKLVIILDEIDALTRTSFSDIIFAQIRSIYFQRDNYKEFGKLTYILSGVIEPTEIIKDKKISPFNIGQKIFLNDFNREEFDCFIQKTTLTFSPEVNERIFHWTNGNPRLTWDICSDLEDKMLAGKDIVVNEVDLTVNKLYLTEFDHAPVDHIRELVESDKSIKDAITVIKYKKGSQLSDEIKRKLYLAGIINSDYNKDNVTIKSKLIEECLSDEWLLNIDRKRKGLVKVADEYFNDGHYVEADKLYVEYLSNNILDDNSSKSIYYHRGICNYKIQNYALAIECFEKGMYDKEGYANIYYETIFILGVCYLNEKNYDASIAKFKEIIDSKLNNQYYYGALLNLGSIYILLDPKQYEHEILNINNEIIDKIGQSRSENEREEFLIIKIFAIFNMGKIYENLQNKDEAKRYYQMVSELCSISHKPTTLLSLYQIEDVLDKKKSIILQIKDIIIQNRLKAEPFNYENLLGLTQDIILTILLELLNCDHDDDFEQLANYVISNNNFEQVENPHHLLLGIGKAFIYEKNIEKSKRIFDKILLQKNRYNDTQFVYFESAKFSIMMDHNYDPKNENVKLYFDYFLTVNRPQKIDYLDLTIITNIILFCIKDDKNYSEARRYIHIANSYRSNIDKELMVNYFMIDYYDLVIDYYFHDSNPTEIAKRMIVFSGKINFSNEKYCIFSKEDYTSMLNVAKEVLNSKNDVNKENTHFERNQRVIAKYKDGRVVVKKYKFIEDDYKNDLCELSIYQQLIR